MSPNPLAPDLIVDDWFNTKAPLRLEELRGRVVLLHAFQMLCPGCVMTGTPQAEKAHRLFAGPDLVVIGLHTVFEHHAAMTPVSLAAFIHEYRLTMPIAVDRPGVGSPIPQTMQLYGLRGTPSSILISRDGRILHHAFGSEDDMTLGARIAMALGQPVLTPETTPMMVECDENGCRVPV